MAKSLNHIIEAAREDLAGKNIVAFLGEKGTGKTVICAILKDSLVRHFVKDSDEWDAWVTDGKERMNEITNNLTHGVYPAATLPGDAKPITIEIFSKKGVGGSIEITLRDMAGEQRDRVLVDEYPSVDDRLRDILTTSPIEGKPYGLLSHIAFAKVYIILIDCDKFEEIKKQEQAYLANMIKHLHEIKIKIGDVIDNKIHNPIAIIFSKYDTLEKEDGKPAKELFKELTEFETALNIAYNGELKFFTSSVKSTRLTQTEIEKIITETIQTKHKDLNEARAGLKNTEVRKQDGKSELDNAKNELQNAQKELDEAKAINQPPEIQQATQKFEEVEKNLEECEEKYETVIQELDMARINLKSIEEKLKKERPSAKELSVSEFKPEEPLSYSLDQYLDFINWIIEKNKR